MFANIFCTFNKKSHYLFKLRELLCSPDEWDFENEAMRDFENETMQDLENETLQEENKFIQLFNDFPSPDEPLFMLNLFKGCIKQKRDRRYLFEGIIKRLESTLRCHLDRQKNLETPCGVEP